MHSAELERQPELGQAANRRLEEVIRRLQIESAGTGEIEEGLENALVVLVGRYFGWLIPLMAFLTDFAP